MLNKVLLIFVLLLAFYMAFIPHIGYAYPLHVDEWMHMTYAETIAQAGSITFPDPFTGLTDIKLGDNLWVGYHILLAMFQQVSGIDWIVLFRFGPSITFMFIVLAVYILADRQGFGLEAAFFTCLIPTTGGLLGPAFMVPMAMAMLFIPLSLFLAFNIKGWPSYLLIFLFTSFLLISHATTAIVVCILLFPYILLTFKGNSCHSAGVLAALILPFALSLPWTYHIAAQTVGQLLVPQYFSPYIELPDILLRYGVLPSIVGLLGTIVLVIKGSRRGLALVLGLALLLMVMLVFIRLHYGLATVYERGLTVMLLILSVLAGAGLVWLRRLKLAPHHIAKHRSVIFKVAGPAACLSLAVVVLLVALPARLNASFYHMIDDEDYRAFTWIKDNIGAEYSMALVDPWKATAFAAIAGKQVLHRIWVNQEPIDDRIYGFLQNGYVDSAFLRDNRVSFVCDQAQGDNRDLVAVRKMVYVTNPNISSSFARGNELQNAGFEAVYGYPPAYWGRWIQNCKPSFLFPELGRNLGSCVGIKMLNNNESAQIPIAEWIQNIPVQAGRTYQIGGWIKTENIVGRGGAALSPQWQGPGTGTSLYTWISATDFMPQLRGTNGWVYFQGDATAPPGATICTLCCLMSDCSGTAWYDDILFKEK